ncbi:MAG: hypothetical protein ABEH78_04600 [Haloferacaceae archaeon]
MSDRVAYGSVTTDGEGELEPSEIHDVLRNDRRRLVLEQLRDSGESETVRDLSEYIAGIEAGESPPPKNVRQSVYVSLHQTHLPKLDRLEIVSYDAEEKEVRLDDRAAEVTVYMEIVPKYGLSWAEYYFGLGLLGLLVLLAHAVGVPGLSAVDPLVIAAVPLAVLLVSAAYRVGAQEPTFLDRISR